MPQVSKEHYFDEEYDTVERFISYFYQIDFASKSSPESILEIGVGNKLVANSLKSRGFKVTTFDFDESLEPDIIGDVRDIPLDDSAHDLILACQVLEHIPFNDFEKALQEIRRIAKKRVVISLPRRVSSFEAIIKFPFIRTLLGKTFLDFSLQKYLKFPGFEETHQHYFEIDNSKYRLSEVKDRIEKYFEIVKEFSPPLNKYHYFFVLRPKDN